MNNLTTHYPRDVKQVMVSSTFTDLIDHRAALISALSSCRLHPNVMENDSARLVDVIDSSLQMVRDSAAYIGLISLRYGQTPEDARNPDKVSITELEFNEAQHQKRPILLFIMGNDHPVKNNDIEKDPEKEKKLNAFRERAKKIAPGSAVDRVYAVFNSLEEFKVMIVRSLNELSHHLATASPVASNPVAASPNDEPSPLPRPPAFYANPDYIGRHTFIGRAAQLQILSDWANPTDLTVVLLFEAIGGNGKSMLTWEWAKDEKALYSTKVRPDWAGRFWYSFYEKGAIMRSFCQHALAYMTGNPLKAFADRHIADMRPELLGLLKQRPWLLILDGLERVLVAYHRIDAAEVRDEDMNRPTDKVFEGRNPCDAISDEDDDLLRALAGAGPSKILITSRLTPRKLLNQAGTPIPNVLRLKLPGLDPADAVTLLCSCGVEGTPASIRDYLTNYCENHPLVIGVLAGLINSPGPHRGNFDAWAADPDYGAKLNLASIDLIQNRNDILKAAIEALEPTSRQLLATLALLSNAVDYETIEAFNPHIPPEPTFVRDPNERSRAWTEADEKRNADAYAKLSPEKKTEAHVAHEKAAQFHTEYLAAHGKWKIDATSATARKKLKRTLDDLEARGLLQYDRQTGKYDLHPVVRGVASGSQKLGEKIAHGQRVVDHFSSQPHNPYEKAKTMEDVENGLNIVRTLLKIGQHQGAAEAYRGDLAHALLFKLEAHGETLELLRPFFPAGWGELPKGVDRSGAPYVATEAALALDKCGRHQEAIGAYGAAIRGYLDAKNMAHALVGILNFSASLARQNRLAKALRLSGLALDLATARRIDEGIFTSRLNLGVDQSRLGQWEAAGATWKLLGPMGRGWSRNLHRQGDAETYFARIQFWQGTLEEADLSAAVTLAEQDDNRGTIRDLHWLRGTWRLEQGDWAQAAASFARAVTMARERRLVDGASETGLALAKFHLREFTSDDARAEAERLAQLRQPEHRILAMLWRELGNRTQAEKHAMAAYKWAWADGEPYVWRYELTKATELLGQMETAIPTLPPYDRAKDQPFRWEAEVRAAILTMNAEKEAEAKVREENAKGLQRQTSNISTVVPSGSVWQDIIKKLKGSWRRLCRRA